MALSGSSNFAQTRNQLILDAYQLLGVYGIGRTISSEDLAFAVSTLNKMVKAWSAQGLHLWAKEEGILYLTPYTAKYSLGNASTDARATLASDEVITKLNGALAASATSVTVDSTTNMTVSDYIGIVLSDKTVHWTTIATLPSSTTLTLTSGVASAASDNALVYTFTNKIYKPQRILEARKITGYDSGSTSDLVELPLSAVAYSDYFNLPVKTTNSSPTQFHYNPERISGDMYMWPRPSDGAERVGFTFERIIEDLDSVSDDFDFPSEWQECLTYQLAVRLGPAFGKDQRTLQLLMPLAGVLLQNLMAWDSEITSFQMTPDGDG